MFRKASAPPEDRVALLAELDRLYLRRLELVQAINRTNTRTQFDGRVTIADSIAERDLVGKKRDHLPALAEAAATRQDSYSKSERGEGGIGETSKVAARARLCAPPFSSVTYANAIY